MVQHLTFTGYLKGIVTGVDAVNNKVDLKILEELTIFFHVYCRDYAEGDRSEHQFKQQIASHL